MQPEDPKEPTKQAAAREYFLANKDSSLAQTAEAVGCSRRTAAIVRAALVSEGHLEPGRNNMAVHEDEGAREEPKVKKVGAKTKGGVLLTDEMLRKLAVEDEALKELLDNIDNLDDESIRKRLLKEIIKTALLPTNHPDTRMTATQVWIKLKDMARAADYGPGKPMTKEAAILRLTDLLKAVGPEISIESMMRAFDVKEPANGKEATVQAAPSVGTTEAPLAAGHEDQAPQT